MSGTGAAFVAAVRGEGQRKAEAKEAAAAVSSLGSLVAEAFNCAALGILFSPKNFSENGEFFHVAAKDAGDGSAHSIRMYSGLPFWPMLKNATSRDSLLLDLAAYNIRPFGAMDEVEAAEKADRDARAAAAAAEGVAAAAASWGVVTRTKGKPRSVPGTPRERRKADKDKNAADDALIAEAAAQNIDAAREMADQRARGRMPVQRLGGASTRSQTELLGAAGGGGAVRGQSRGRGANPAAAKPGLLGAGGAGATMDQSCEAGATPPMIDSELLGAAGGGGAVLGQSRGLGANPAAAKPGLLGAGSARAVLDWSCGAGENPPTAASGLFGAAGGGGAVRGQSRGLGANPAAANPGLQETRSAGSGLGHPLGDGGNPLADGLGLKGTGRGVSFTAIWPSVPSPAQEQAKTPSRKRTLAAVDGDVTDLTQDDGGRPRVAGDTTEVWWSAATSEGMLVASFGELTVLMDALVPAGKCPGVLHPGTVNARFCCGSPQARQHYCDECTHQGTGSPDAAVGIPVRCVVHPSSTAVLGLKMHYTQNLFDALTPKGRIAVHHAAIGKDPKGRPTLTSAAAIAALGNPSAGVPGCGEATDSTPSTRAGLPQTYGIRAVDLLGPPVHVSVAALGGSSQASDAAVEVVHLVWGTPPISNNPRTMFALLPAPAPGSPGDPAVRLKDATAVEGLNNAGAVSTVYPWLFPAFNSTTGPQHERFKTLLASLLTLDPAGLKWGPYADLFVPGFGYTATPTQILNMLDAWLKLVTPPEKGDGLQTQSLSPLAIMILRSDAGQRTLSDIIARFDRWLPLVAARTVVQRLRKVLTERFLVAASSVDDITQVRIWLLYQALAASCPEFSPL